MTDLDALLAGIVADPHNHLRWLIVADWLDGHGQPEHAERSTDDRRRIELTSPVGGPRPSGVQ